MKKTELLAPAGNMECLKAAILAGCDAVYLGGRFFGARSYSDNFSDEEMIQAINYAHLRGVKVYVTMNTIVYEAEVNAFIDYVDFLHKNNVDAILIQDIGMMDLVRKTFPNLELHASTQMHIHNLEGTKFVSELGLKRAVLARETSIQQIKKIKENTSIELEVFVHGALCISYSGQCLMSSMIGGRSGNRGTCSQCCRKPYELEGKKIDNKYLLSTKDLNSLENIGKLIDIGVDSLKIEGRMKRKEYVYLVVSMYRKAIDSYCSTGNIDITDDDIIELKKIFNREFTTGLLNNQENIVNSKRPNHMGIEIGKVINVSNDKISIKLNDIVRQNDGIRIINSKEDIGFNLNKIFLNNKLTNIGNKNDIITVSINGNVDIGDIVLKTTDSYQLKTIDEKLNNDKKIMITGFIKCLKNNKIILKLDDGINEVEVTYGDVEEATGNGTLKDRILEQVSKLGNTCYELSKLDSDIDSSIFVKISDINEIRRLAVMELDKKRLYKSNYLKKEYSITLPDFKKENGIDYLVNNIDDYNKCKDQATNIYAYNELYNKLNDSKVILKLPRVINEYEEYNDNLLVGELGSVYKYKNVYTDFSLNVVNSYSVAFLHSMGVKLITLSYELNDFQIKKIIDNYIDRYKVKPNLELIVSSYPEDMVMKYDVLKNNGIDINTGYLIDEFKNKFKIVKRDNITTIYHFKKIVKEDYSKYFDMGINRVRINLD